MTVRTIIIFHSTSSRTNRNQIYFHCCCRKRVKHLKTALSHRNQYVMLLSIMYYLSHYFNTLTKCKMAKNKNKLYLYNRAPCLKSTIKSQSVPVHVLQLTDIRNSLPQKDPGRIYRPHHHPLLHLHLPRFHHHQSEYQVCQSIHCCSLKLQYIAGSLQEN